MSILNSLWKIPRKIIVIFHKKLLKRRIKNKEITIISQNCVGGVLYSLIGQQFLSPTINMFIEDNNFVKLVYNLEHYMNIPAEPLTDRYMDPIDPSIHYPKIKIDDIELCCLHYRDCSDAINAWERRRKRVNFKRVLVIANSWNMHEKDQLVRKVCENGKYKTICFTYKKYDYPGCINLNDSFWHIDERGIIRPDITDYKPFSYKRFFETYTDIVKLLNEL